MPDDTQHDAQWTRRNNLAMALDALPDEAFSYVAVKLAPGFGFSGTANGPWPDGLGGFSPASQQAIPAVLDAALRYVTNGEAGFTTKTGG